MSWCIYLLAEHPEVQDKLRKAVQEIDIYAPSLYDDLNQNTYLGYVVNEILRLKRSTIHEFLSERTKN